MTRPLLLMGDGPSFRAFRGFFLRRRRGRLSVFPIPRANWPHPTSEEDIQFSFIEGSDIEEEPKRGTKQPNSFLDSKNDIATVSMAFPNQYFMNPVLP